MTATTSEILALVTGEAEASEAWATMQKLINDGTAWRLEGSFGRSAMDAVESGHCLFSAQSGITDYWGNRLPSRDEVVSGSAGSLAYVRETMGDEWASRMAAL